MKKALKSLSEPQWYIIDVKSFNVHTFSLEMHFSDISDLEEKVEEELMSVDAAHQQFNKVMLQWRATQNLVSQIQKKQQQKNAKLFLIKAIWESIYCEMWKLQEPVILQKISLNMNVNENNCQSEVKKFNSRIAVVTPVSEPVRVSAFTHVLK